MDPTAPFKAQQKVAWSNFAIFENVTSSTAGKRAAR